MKKLNNFFTVRSQPASRLAWKIRIIRSRAFVALVVCFFSRLALAQTPVPGGYAPNAASGMKAFIMVQGGTFILENSTLFNDSNPPTIMSSTMEHVQ